MRRTVSAAVLAAVLAAAPQATEAQVAVDSVEVQIYAPGDITVSISPPGFTGLVGDTVQFEATAVDQVTGDTLDVLAVWSTPNPEGVSIDSATGEAVFLARGNWVIRVEIERIGDILVFQLLSGQVQPIPSDGLTLNVGEERQLCAYLTNAEGTIVARSATICPFPASSPSWVFTLPYDRIMERRRTFG